MTYLSAFRPCLFMFLWVLVLVPSAFGGYKQINKPNPADEMNVHIFRLDNGLTVYLSENHETPRFYSEIAVRAGSKHDPAETTGLAHYLEHLLFKGTRSMGTLDYEKEKPYLDTITELYERHFGEGDPEKRKEIYAEINRVSQEAAKYAIANEIDKLYKTMGGTMVNAYTSNEQTVYMVSLPANRLRQWAVIESERFSKPVFRLFHTELETVYEEKNRTLDNRDWVLYEAVNAALFKVHPYGQQTTIGTVEHLKRPSIRNIERYFDTYYVPNNMAICISGDINIDETIALLDEHFSKWAPKELPKPKKWKEPPLEGRQQVTVKFQGEPQVTLAFRTAPRGHKDQAALRVLDMVLDNSVAGLINLHLVQQQRVRRAGSSPEFLNDFGWQELFGVPKDGQTLEEVERLLLEQIELLKAGEFEDWILDAIVTDFKKNEKTRLETDHARVASMTDAFVGFQDWDHYVAAIERMEKVTRRDVVRAAKKYFGGGYVAGYRLDEQHEVPQIEKPQIDPVDIDPTRQSVFAKRVLEMPYREIEPDFVEPGVDYRKVRYADGVDLYYARNPLNDLFSLSINVEFGTHENNKIAIATRLMDKSGTERLSAEDLKKEWYKLGCDYGISAGDNESFIRLSGLDENFDKALALLMEVLTKPTADGETLEELKSIILIEREDAKKNPGTLSSALTNFNRYGRESYFLRMLPSEEVKQLTVEELHGIIKGLLGYKHTISYVGSLPLDEVERVLHQHHSIQEGLMDPPPYRYLIARQPSKNEIYFFNKEMAQAQVRIEFADGKFDEANDTAVDLYNAYFAGGMSGIVFQELREARGLAYSAAAQYATGPRKDDENLVIGVIGCQADKTPEALAAFIDLFDNMPKSPERFDEAVNSIVNRYRTSKIGFRGVIGAVRSWEHLGLPVDPRKERFERVQRADMDTLMNFHAERIRGKPKLISIVGDKSRIDMEALGKIADIREISLDQLFVN